MRKVVRQAIAMVLAMGLCVSIAPIASASGATGASVQAVSGVRPPLGCTTDLRIWYDQDQYGTWPKAITSWSGCGTHWKSLETWIACDRSERARYVLQGTSSSRQSTARYIGTFSSCTAQLTGFVSYAVDDWYSWRYGYQPT